jgi:hypothetical protein
MTDMSQISTSNLLSFIHGNAVEPYGDADAAKAVRLVLESSMKYAVENANQWRDGTGDEEIGGFLITAYAAFSIANVRLRMVSTTFQMSWQSHYNKWLETYAKLLETNPDTLGSTTNMKLPGLGDTKDVASAVLNEISATLFRWYLSSLEKLVAIENESVQEDDAWTTEFRDNILKRFENKLHLEADAVINDLDTSRLISVEHASQTAKSRLAEE